MRQAGTNRRKFQSDGMARPDAANCSCQTIASLTAIRLARPILRKGKRPALISRYAVERLQLFVSQNCLMVMNRSMIALGVAGDTALVQPSGSFLEGEMNQSRNPVFVTAFEANSNATPDHSEHRRLADDGQSYIECPCGHGIFAQ